MPEPTINSSTITAAQIKYCLSLYPKVVEKHYKSKTKDQKRVPEALARDKWRYEELPLSLKGQNGNAKGVHMSLEQLERLVQWKITHGHSRPFLPAMIRKNSAKDVSATMISVAGKCASKASVIAESKSGQGKPVDPGTVLEDTLKVLDDACSLTGVGPATGSLILSIYDPINVPFFEDEMFNWACADLGKIKLKYDKKEYSELFRRIWKLRELLGLEVAAVEIEKASFVLEHWNFVDEKDQDAMPAYGNVITGTKTVIEKDAANEDDAHEQAVRIEAKVRDAAKKGTKRGTPKPEPKAGNQEDNDVAKRRSKRVKK